MADNIVRLSPASVFIGRALRGSLYAAAASALGFVVYCLAVSKWRCASPHGDFGGCFIDFLSATSLVGMFACIAFMVAFFHALLLGAPYAWFLERFRLFRRIPAMLGGCAVGTLPSFVLRLQPEVFPWFVVLGGVAALAFHAGWSSRRKGDAHETHEPSGISSASTPTRVYYNSACPVCRTGIGMQRDAMGACEIEWIDVHENPDAVRELGVDIEAVRERLHVRDAGGVKVGADAAAALWSRTRGLRWASRLLALPRVRALAQRAYAAFARWLYRWNRRHGRW